MEHDQSCGLHRGRGETMKKLLGILVILLLATFAAAHEHEDDIAEGKQLVDSKVPCDQLSDDQLEEIGEYLMEQMHPGEAHDQMHEMMGIKEDTPEHEQFHVHIAQMMYCNKGMMGGRMPMMRGGMMGPGMMYGGMMGGSYSPGMMGGWAG